MKAIILAAGFGTRLYPLTKRIPKALIHIHEEPCINSIVSKLETISVIDEIIIVANHKFYEDFQIWEMEHDFRKPIRIVDNGVSYPEDSKGSIGDLLLGMEEGSGVRRYGYLTVSGDNYFQFPLENFVQKCLQNPGYSRVGVTEFSNRESVSNYGVVQLDNRTRKVTGFEEKPQFPKSNLISLGIYYFPTSSIFRVREFLFENNNPDKMGDFIKWLSGKKDVYGYEFEGLWSDIGDVNQLREAKYRVRRGILK